MRQTLILFPFFAAACTSVPANSDDCGAVALQHLVGTPVVGVASIDTGGPVRVVTPNLVTSEGRNPDRLSIYTDRSGDVIALRCG